MHRVLFVYVGSETISQLDGYGPMPSACLFEDGDTGRRWMLADSPITPGAWSQASEYGAAGLVRTAPLRYVAAEHVVEHREISGMLLDVPERWWIPHAGPKLPSVPLLAAALLLPKSRFCNIHVHSEFSPLDGLATVQEIVDAAVADNQEFVAVTDHGYCAAHPQLSKVAQAAGVKPLFGIEANLVNNRFEVEKEIVLKPDGSSRERAHYWHFILLAMNDVGLRNLWAASSEAHITGFHGRPRMDWSTLERFNEGIIASTACLRGPLASLILSGDMEGAERMLARLISIFRDRLYVELHANHLPDQLVVNAGLVELARKFSLPTICVSDSHYACFDEQDLHQVWIAVQTDKDLTEDQDLFAGNQHYHVHSADDMVRALDYLPPSIVEESMRNTVEIGQRCTATIKQRTSMPVFHRHAVKGSTIGSGVERDVEVLRQKAEEGFALRCAHKDNVQVYRDQVEKELDLMISKGFAGYFLVVDDYCEAARSGRAHPQGKKILMGPGRGSVVGSLVAWLLGITKIDPIEADLMFERFLTPGRTSPPDIDLDFPSSERDSITNYTIDRWGADRVVRVGTHGRLKNKGVIQKVAKALSARFPVDFMHLKEISAIITAAEAHTAGAGLKWDELWEQEGELLEPFRLLYPEVFGTCDSLVKRLSSYGRHASGIVIDPEESIVDRLPLRTAGDKDNRQIVTEFDFEWLEFLGFLKFDFLTLRTLDTIQQCVDMIADDPSHGVHIDIDQWVDEYEDPQVWDMLCEGDTLGVFQIETSEGSKLVRRMQPRTIADLSAILTLVRPGPMRSGLTDSYIRRRFGEEEIVAALPELEPVLGRTYQCMIYQEDIMAVCQTLAGYDLAEADKVRAILGKKKVEEAKKEGRRFIERCKERGLDETTVEHIWAQMEEFAKYTFNRAHSWSYAVLAYWCAWLKCHYPVHFLVAVLSTIEKGRIPEFVELARRNGYTVGAPDVNESSVGFSVSGDRLGVRYGFGSIPDIGDAAAEAIIEGQPYQSWDDFLERRGPKCNWGHIKKLAAVGTFDSLLPRGQHRAALERLIEQMAEGKAIVCVHKLPGYQGPNGLPCGFNWEAEVTLGKSGKPLKQRPLPKACTRACRQYTEQDTYTWPLVDPLTEKEVRERERTALGVYLSSTPFDAVSVEYLDAEGIIYGFDAESAPFGNHVVFGMVQSIRKHVDRSGNAMAFVRINSRGYEMDVTVFSRLWFQIEHQMKKDGLALFEINRNARGSTLTNFYPINV